MHKEFLLTNAICKTKKKKSKEKNIFNFVYTWKNVKKTCKNPLG